MPLDAYFRGNGSEVMSAMKKTYGDPKKAQAVFYATANKQNATPKAVGPRKQVGGGAKQRKPSMRKRATKTA